MSKLRVGRTYVRGVLLSASHDDAMS